MPVTVEAPLTDGVISSSWLQQPVRNEERERARSDRIRGHVWEGLQALNWGNRQKVKYPMLINEHVFSSEGKQRSFWTKCAVVWYTLFDQACFPLQCYVVFCFSSDASHHLLNCAAWMIKEKAWFSALCHIYYCMEVKLIDETFLRRLIYNNFIKPSCKHCSFLNVSIFYWMSLNGEHFGHFTSQLFDKLGAQLTDQLNKIV